MTKKYNKICNCNTIHFNNADNSSLSPKSPISQWCHAEEPAQEFENWKVAFATFKVQQYLEYATLSETVLRNNG